MRQFVIITLSLYFSRMLKKKLALDIDNDLQLLVAKVFNTLGILETFIMSYLKDSNTMCVHK